MIIKQEFETLANVRGVDNCDLKSLVEQSRDMVKGWKNLTVNNETGVNFSISEDMKFNYLATTGEKRTADISEFAFSQLCTRLGVPASYVKKCFDNGKVNLALDNFQAWAGDCDKNMLIREHNGVARAVLSDSYAPFDSYQVLRALNYTVSERFKPSQVFLSEDRLNIRFVDYEPLATNDGSQIFPGFTVSSSDVGRGSLSVKFFLYRYACQNGLVVSSMGGTLFRQSHIGASMSESKIAVFNRAFMDLQTLSERSNELIKVNRDKHLKDFELQMYLSKARSELKLSEKSMDKLTMLIGGKYEMNTWGVINSVTELAQDFTLDTRIALESWAGDLFTKSAA